MERTLGARLFLFVAVVVAFVHRRLTFTMRRLWLHLLAKHTDWKHAETLYFSHLISYKPTLLFICYGNICRSPFAEGYFRNLRDDSQHAITAQSAGIHIQEGRPTPYTAQVVAEEFGVDLSTHASVCVTAELIRWAGAIVCMDVENHEHISRRYQDAQNKLFFLGSFGPQFAPHIPDPWGKCTEEFRKCYGLIATSVEALAERCEMSKADGWTSLPQRSRSLRHTV
jgi:protein-tyrosine-phosphatase